MLLVVSQKFRQRIGRLRRTTPLYREVHCRHAEESGDQSSTTYYRPGGAATGADRRELPLRLYRDTAYRAAHGRDCRTVHDLFRVPDRTAAVQRLDRIAGGGAVL